MRKINKYINYGRLMLVVLLVLIGSEPAIPTVLYLLCMTFAAICGAELYLLRLRNIYARQHEEYIKTLSRVVSRELVSTLHADLPDPETVLAELENISDVGDEGA